MNTCRSASIIPVRYEPVDFHLYVPEACAFCGEPTRYWTDIETLSDGEQVACCTRCAEKHKPGEVPTKSEWYRRETEKRKRRGPCA